MKKTVVIMIAILVVGICLSGCGGSNSVSGKWYIIDSNAETASGNIELKSGGEFYTDGLTGTWEEKDGTVQIDLMGIHQVFTVGDYEGYQVLYKEGSETPRYCHSPEDSAAVYELMTQ